MQETRLQLHLFLLELKKTLRRPKLEAFPPRRCSSNRDDATISDEFNLYICMVNARTLNFNASYHLPLHISVKDLETKIKPQTIARLAHFQHTTDLCIQFSLKLLRRDPALF